MLKNAFKSSDSKRAKRQRPPLSPPLLQLQKTKEI
jgi:hypothetical protein